MAGTFRSPGKIARRLRLTPSARRELRSWVPFMAAYAWGAVPRRPYVFRSGAKLRIGRGVDHVPIIEVFLRRDYGVIPDGATVLDLGASTGVFTVFAGATAGRIVAYEPMPAAYALLTENVRLNGLAVETVNAAVAGESGTVELFTQGFFPTLVGSGESVKVRALTLAEILERHGLARVDLLKLDVEGAEYDVLYGAAPETLERIGEIRMEGHDLDDERRNVAALQSFLAERGFQGTRVERDPSGTWSLWFTLQG